MTNTEIRSITPEGGDVRIEEVDLDAERAQSNNADMEVAAAINGLVHEYNDLIADASQLLEEYGQDEDLQESLSGLSDIIQGAAHSQLELQTKAGSGASAEAMLGGKSLEDLKDDHEYSIEAMRKRIDMMKVIAGATDRQDRLEEAREGVEGVEGVEERSVGEIAKGIVEGKSEVGEEASQQEREKGLEAAQKKLDLKSVASILDGLSNLTPTTVSENVSGLAKLLDGDGKATFKASFDMNGDISQSATEIAKRLSMDREAITEAGVDAEQFKKLVYNLQVLGENTKKRADEIAATSRGVSKRELGTLREQTDRLSDVKLLLSPDNAGGDTIRDGKTVDSSKRLAKLREGTVY